MMSSRFIFCRKDFFTLWTFKIHFISRISCEQVTICISLLRIFNFFSKIIKLLVCGALDLTDGGGSLIFAVLIKSRSRSSREGTPGWAIEFPFCWEGLGALVRHGRLKMLLNCSNWSQDTFREQFKVSHVMVIVKLEPPGRGHWPMVSTWPLRPLIMWIRP